MSKTDISDTRFAVRIICDSGVVAYY